MAQQKQKQNTECFFYRVLDHGALSHRNLASPGHPMTASVLRNKIKGTAFTYKPSLQIMCLGLGHQILDGANFHCIDSQKCCILYKMFVFMSRFEKLMYLSCDVRREYAR
jgi:hypothetical protein